MTRLDDSSLSPHELQTVKTHAERLLREASALGVFPTPIERIMAAAKLTVVEDEFLDESVLQRFMKKARSSLGAVKSALGKVWGLLHVPERLVLIDSAAPPPSKPFLKLHEAGHSAIPHQSKMYSLIHDSENSLDPYITDLFEREANVFAAETLFQGEQFSEEARQYDFGMNAPLKLSERYGASVYSSFRRYVTSSSNSCCVIVLEPAVMGQGKEFSAAIRRTVVSETFIEIFDPLDFGPCIHHRHYLAHLVPVGRKMTGRRSITIFDRNGTRRKCSAEAFNSKHHMFVLIKDEGPAPTILLP